MNMKDLAPIILFVYNRPEHTRQTLEALAQNELAKVSRLIIFADGLKPDASEEEQKRVAKVRSVIAAKKWCGQVEIVKRKQNWGLAKSIATAKSLFWKMTSLPRPGF